MESSSNRIAKIDGSDITVHKVFSTCLDPRKTWFSLNIHLCCTKPSTFCSSATAKLFQEEYALVSFEDLIIMYRLYSATRDPAALYSKSDINIKSIE